MVSSVRSLRLLDPFGGWNLLLTFDWGSDCCEMLSLDLSLFQLMACCIHLSDLTSDRSYNLLLSLGIIRLLLGLHRGGPCRRERCIWRLIRSICLSSSILVLQRLLPLGVWFLLCWRGLANCEALLGSNRRFIILLLLRR